MQGASSMNKITPKSEFDADRAYRASERLADFLGFGRRAVAAQRLTEMDDHLLRDIGVVRDQISTVTGLNRKD